MDTTKPSLLLRVRDPNDTTAWAEFVSIYRPLLTRYASARGLHEADAEDVAQHCLGLITKKIRHFDYDPCRGRFRGWLRRIVDNRVTDLLRRQRERQGEPADFMRPQQRERSPDETWGRIWLEEHLRHGLQVVKSQVRPNTYEAFFRTAIEDQPVEEVAAELGMTANQIHAARFRVTRRLHRVMHELLGEHAL